MTHPKPDSKITPPLSRRFCAYAIDWFAGDLAAAFPVAMVNAIATQKTQVVGSITEVPGNYALTAGVLSLVFIFLYYIFIPWKMWGGQTAGKRLCRIRIVTCGSKKPGLAKLMTRQVLGMIILENGLLSAGRYLREFTELFLHGGTLPSWLQYGGYALGAISAVLVVFTPSGRALHDYLSNTRVVAVREERKVCP